jgi:hypothetical protein
VIAIVIDPWVRHLDDLANEVRKLNITSVRTEDCEPQISEVDRLPFQQTLVARF